GDYAMKESRERIRAAVQNSGFEYPTQQIVVNLAPNDRPKEGATAELAMVVAILIASGQIDKNMGDKVVFIGSLSLDGTLHSPSGLMNCVIEARRIVKDYAIAIPSAALKEVECIPGLNAYPLESLADLRNLTKMKSNRSLNTHFRPEKKKPMFNMSEIIGQEKAKLGLAYAASGKHHTVMMGSPGTGKTMLARAFAGILPPLDLNQSLETSRIYSACGLLQGRLVQDVPFRSPHHTSSEIALVGGGPFPRPGEASLAHNGVLFLDELLEFRSSTLQTLREPLEERKITISRVRAAAVFPADFILLGAANPCRCGYLFSPGKTCVCATSQIRLRQQKITGPFLDRISLEIETLEEPGGVFMQNGVEKSSEWWLSKVMEARVRMKFRNGPKSNSRLLIQNMLPVYTQFSRWQKIVDHHADFYGLSRRGIMNSLRLALTIMDFRETSSMTEEILEEAFSFRAIASFQKSNPELVA
ncbi:MAG: YifB family Mg chelatase-like AAA ATPase, partial [Leptospirales bacterium]